MHPALDLSKVTSMSVAAAAVTTDTSYSTKNLKLPPNMGRRTQVEGALYNTEVAAVVEAE